MKKKVLFYRNKWHSNILREINRISAITQNEALVARNTDFSKSDLYNYYRRIHQILHIYQLNSMNYVRVGNKNDGGYVIASPYSRNKICYSIGISDDVSFDKCLAAEGYNIYQYDHTIRKLPEKNEKYHWQKIGITGDNETKKLKNLESMILQNKHENLEGMFLKIDVEGFEWDVLNRVTDKTLNQFDQIAIELHWLNETESMEKMLSALERLTRNHSVIHIHGNNWDTVNYVGDLITPSTIEVTLVRNGVYELVDKDIVLPRKLDKPNIPELADIYIGNWNIH